MGWKNNQEDEENTEWMPLDRKLRGKVIRKIWFSSMNWENLILITINFVVMVGTIWLITTIVGPKHRAMHDYIVGFLIVMICFIMLFVVVIMRLIPMIKTTIYIFRGKGYIGTAKVLETRYDDGRICGREIVSRAYYELTIMMNKEGKKVQYELSYVSYTHQTLPTTPYE